MYRVNSGGIAYNTLEGRKGISNCVHIDRTKQLIAEWPDAKQEANRVKGPKVNFARENSAVTFVLECPLWIENCQHFELTFTFFREINK